MSAKYADSAKSRPNAVFGVYIVAGFVARCGCFFLKALMIEGTENSATTKSAIMAEEIMGFFSPHL